MIMGIKEGLRSKAIMVINKCKVIINKDVEYYKRGRLNSVKVSRVQYRDERDKVSKSIKDRYEKTIGDIKEGSSLGGDYAKCDKIHLMVSEIDQELKVLNDNKYDLGKYIIGKYDNLMRKNEGYDIYVKKVTSIIFLSMVIGISLGVILGSVLLSILSVLTGVLSVVYQKYVYSESELSVDDIKYGTVLNEEDVSYYGIKEKEYKKMRTTLISEQKVILRGIKKVEKPQV